MPESDDAAGAGLERQERGLQDAAGRREHEAQAQVGDADAGGACRVRGRFPTAADRREESAAHGGGLVHRRRAVEPVEPDGGGAQERLGWCRQRREGAGDGGGPLDAAVAHERHALRRPALVGDAGAGEVDADVEPRQLLRLEEAARGIPRRVDDRLDVGWRRRLDGVLAAHEADDAVAARGQEVGERPADEAAGAGDADGEPRPGGDPGVRGEVGGERLVAVAQQGREAPLDHPPGQGAADRAAGAGELDPVLEHRRAGAAVGHRVVVDPVREGALDLHVREAVRRADVAVLGDPRDAERADGHLEGHPRAFGEIAGPGEHPHGIPRRRQALERARPDVPRPERGERHGHRGAPGDGIHGGSLVPWKRESLTKLPGEASRLAALLLARISPICSIVAPCQTGAALRDFGKIFSLPGDSSPVGLAPTTIGAVRVADFDFHLPPEQIAQAPPAERGTSRLLVLERATGAVTHARIADLPGWLRAGDLLVVNDTRVFPARLLGRREPSGGRVEVFLLERLGPDRFDALVHPGQKLKPGARVVLEGEAGPDGPVIHGEIEARGSFGRRTIRLQLGTSPEPGADAIDAAVDAIGHMPLPPYIARPDAGGDRERYQTVYARDRGSVAAPTAGLHFTPELLAAIDARGVERAARDAARRLRHLQAGARRGGRGRTSSTRSATRSRRRWPRAIDAARAEGRRVVAVGTTTVRALESAGRGGPIAAGPRHRRDAVHPYPGHRLRARRRAAHQLPPAALVAAHAGVRLCRPRAGPCARIARPSRAGLPLLQLRRRDADRLGRQR